METLFITNRDGKRIAVLVERAERQQGLAFIAHGLGGTKEQPHIETYARAFYEAGYTTVRWDATNSFGESDGDYEDATTTNYLHDMEDVIAWASGNPWYHVPFVLVGHSLGSLCALLYAEAHPNQVKAIAPTSTVISGELSLRTASYNPALVNEWKRTGMLERRSAADPNRVKRLKWNHMEDRLLYDVLLHAEKITMPVFLLAGSGDDHTPPAHQKILLDRLPGTKELHIIEGAKHTFAGEKELSEVKTLLSAWIATLA